MTARIVHTLALATAAAAACYGTGAMAQVPAAVAAPGETTVATFQGEGAQIYQCKAGNDGKLSWVFREPIATLILNDKTVGRHYACSTTQGQGCKANQANSFLVWAHTNRAMSQARYNVGATRARPRRANDDNDKQNGKLTRGSAGYAINRPIKSP